MDNRRGWLTRMRRWVPAWLGLLGLIVVLGLGKAIAQDAPSLPPLSAYPLPDALVAWNPDSQDDYFDEITPIEGIGYLVWPDRPVQVYVEPPTDLNDRSQVWSQLVQGAVHDWSLYFPLALTTQLEDANIAIWRDTPSIQWEANQSPRARSAETRYRIFVDSPDDATSCLRHQMTLIIRPGQSDQHIAGATRHELGHALGLWGHSPLETDALYYSQVRNPPPISVRDVNTLKRLYEQPTRLGWPLVRSPSIP